jgi:Protein of unknown function (DUF3489)
MESTTTMRDMAASQRFCVKLRRSGACPGKPARKREPVSEEEKAAPARARFEGSKLGRLVAMLCRPEGATVEQIAAETGWQHHSIRGAISGALKKKMGLTVTTERVREVGPEKVGAKGSTTIYRDAHAAA